MIKSEIKNNTGIILLSRPEKHNALNPELVKILKNKLNEFELIDEVYSIIISGEGDSFCAGADLEYLKLLSGNSVIDNYNDSKSLAELFLMIYNFKKPTIAAVNGPAIAGGSGLASVCDFIVAHPEKSKFGYSEVKIGFLPAIVSIFLIKKIGEGLSKQLMLEGGLISGKRAYEINLVNYLTEDVLTESLNLATRLNKNSKESLRLTKQMINNISNLNAEEAVAHCIYLNIISRSTADFKTGLEKFLNKDK